MPDSGTGPEQLTTSANETILVRRSRALQAASLAVVLLIAGLVVWLDLSANNWARLHLPPLGVLDLAQIQQPLFLAVAQNGGLLTGVGAGTSLNIIATLFILPALGLMLLLALDGSEAIIILGLGLMTGGGLGNSYERLAHGSVTDFIAIGGAQGMAMNLADLSMLAGITLIFLGFLVPELINLVSAGLALSGRLARTLGRLPRRAARHSR